MPLSLRHLILSLILLFSTGVLRAQCEGKSGIALIICNGAQRIPGGAAAGPLAPFVQYLLDEQPVTTSFHNTRPADPTARYLAPANYAPLSTLPRTADGAFLLRPGAYEGYLQSYCLKAGTYGPSQGDGYLAAPLTGPKAAIVRTILKQAPRHPEVRQQDIQQLLWAVIAKVDYRQMPQEMHRTAAALLPPRELEQLRGGIISRLPDAFRQPLEQHIQRRLAVVQGPLRQVLHAENNLRTQIATRASFDVMARTAVLAGAAPADPTMPPVPRGAWIQNRQGFYLRYLPDSYSRTKVQLVVPESTPTTTADPLIFDPTEELAVPANTAGQRLGLTARDQDGVAPAPCGDQTIQSVFSPDAPNYHRYPDPSETIRTKLCDKRDSRCSKASAFRLMLSDSRFIAPTEDSNPVTNCKVTSVDITRYGMNRVGLAITGNPIRSVVDVTSMAVTNYTKPGHFLHPGKVVRTIIEDDTAVYVDTWGEGTGIFPTVNGVLAPGVWYEADRRLLTAVIDDLFQIRR